MLRDLVKKWNLGLNFLSFSCLIHFDSAFMHKEVKTTRAFQLDSLCDFTETEMSHSVVEHDPTGSKEDVTSKVAKDKNSESPPNQVSTKKDLRFV